MLIAITGATGFIGGYMVRGLAAAGHSVRALCRPGREDGLARPGCAALEVQIGDLLDPDSVQGFLKDIDVLIHLASLHDHNSEDDMQRVNIRGTEALLEEARTALRRLLERGSG